jgi:hypothetical protein
MLRKIVAFTIFLLLAACSPAATAAPGAAPQPEDTPTLAATETLLVPVTSLLTETIAPSATATKTSSPTPSQSPTAVVNLQQAQVINILNGVGGISLVVKIANLAAPYDMILAGIKYTCHLEEQYPEWLLCWGLSRPPLDEQVNQAFVDQASGKVIFEQKVILSSALLPTALPEGYGFTNCPDRGKNISCETECRLDYDGNPCIVATCTDACGLYRSVHSCPDDMPLPSPLCSAEQWAEAKAKYGIP